MKVGESVGKYYDGAKLLSLMDINGNRPEIYMCTTNRTGGKTTFFGRLCANGWKRNAKNSAWFIVTIMNWTIVPTSSLRTSAGCSLTALRSPANDAQVVSSTNFSGMMNVADTQCH